MLFFLLQPEYTFLFSLVWQIIMKRYAVAKGMEFVKMYYKNNESIRTTIDHYVKFIVINNRPAKLIIRDLIKKFKLIGSVRNFKNQTRQKRKCTAKNMDPVNLSMNENPEQSIARRSKEL